MSISFKQYDVKRYKKEINRIDETIKRLGKTRKKWEKRLEIKLEEQ